MYKKSRFSLFLQIFPFNFLNFLNTSIMPKSLSADIENDIKSALLAGKDSMDVANRFKVRMQQLITMRTNFSLTDSLDLVVNRWLCPLRRRDSSKFRWYKANSRLRGKYMINLWS